MHARRVFDEGLDRACAAPSRGPWLAWALLLSGWLPLLNGCADSAEDATSAVESIVSAKLPVSPTEQVAATTRTTAKKPIATARLSVRLLDLPSDHGKAVVGLFADEASFHEKRDPVREAFATIRSGVAECDWSDVPLGIYAIAAYHDVDEDRSLDRNSFGMPTEANGFSNDARRTFGAPDFRDARFEVTGPTELTIHLVRPPRLPFAPARGENSP